MKKIKEIIVVEGKSDKCFLETFIDADILTCNGSAIDGFDIDYLKEFAKTRGVIILTDPDYPGEKIRKYLMDNIKDAKHAFVRREFASNGKKLGVAECDKQEVLRALDNVVSFNLEKVGSLTTTDMMKLHLTGQDSTKQREKVAKYYHIGICNNKTMLKRLNLLNVSYDKLKELLNDK